MRYRDLTDEMIESMRESGEAAARSEAQYKIELAKRELELREAGLPVTMVKHQAEGDHNVATLKFESDCASVNYKADHEAVMSFKKRADDLRDQLAREWGQCSERV